MYSVGALKTGKSKLCLSLAGHFDLTSTHIIDVSAAGCQFIGALLAELLSHFSSC